LIATLRQRYRLVQVCALIQKIKRLKFFRKK